MGKIHIPWRRRIALRWDWHWRSWARGSLKAFVWILFNLTRIAKWSECAFAHAIGWAEALRDKMAPRPWMIRELPGMSVVNLRSVQRVGTGDLGPGNIITSHSKDGPIEIIKLQEDFSVDPKTGKVHDLHPTGGPGACPRCGSRAVFQTLIGFFGGEDTVNTFRCDDCGLHGLVSELRKPNAP
jgi:hypothetical protein